MDDFNLTWLANGAGGSRQPGLQAELRRLGVGPYACRHMSAKGDFYALGLTGGRDSAARRAALLKALELPERMTANALLEAVNLLYGREEFFPLAEGLTPAGTSPGQSSK